jgi:hypothetical protein
MCNFKVNFIGSAEEILAKAKSTVEAQGGQFEGDLKTGSFYVSLLSNKVAGSYAVEGNELSLTITDKPMFVPCNAIEAFLTKQLS